jgi:hypothetical protein
MPAIYAIQKGSELHTRIQGGRKAQTYSLAMTISVALKVEVAFWRKVLSDECVADSYAGNPGWLGWIAVRPVQKTRQKRRKGSSTYGASNRNP